MKCVSQYAALPEGRGELHEVFSKPLLATIQELFERLWKRMHISAVKGLQNWLCRLCREREAVETENRVAVKIRLRVVIDQAYTEDRQRIAVQLQSASSKRLSWGDVVECWLENLEGCVDRVVESTVSTVSKGAAQSSKSFFEKAWVEDESMEGWQQMITAKLDARGIVWKKVWRCIQKCFIFKLDRYFDKNGECKNRKHE